MSNIHIGTVCLSKGEKSPGSVTTFIRKFERGLRTRDLEVPCGSCNSCCRTPKLLVDDLSLDEMARFSDHVEYKDGHGPVLKKREDGSCVLLVDGKCSVYNARPKACRVFDCRLDLLLGIIPDDPVMRPAYEQWAAFRMPLVEDHEALLAVRQAVFEGGPPCSMREIHIRFFYWRRFLEGARRMLRLLEATPEQGSA